MSYNSRIILAKIVTYFSQNYAGTLGSSLTTTMVFQKPWRIVHGKEGVRMDVPQTTKQFIPDWGVKK